MSLNSIAFSAFNTNCIESRRAKQEPVFGIRQLWLNLPLIGPAREMKQRSETAAVAQNWRPEADGQRARIRFNPENLASSQGKIRLIHSAEHRSRTRGLQTENSEACSKHPFPPEAMPRDYP
jgi:hypothetical protein